MEHREKHLLRNNCLIHMSIKTRLSTDLLLGHKSIFSSLLEVKLNTLRLYFRLTPNLGHIPWVILIDKYIIYFIVYVFFFHFYMLLQYVHTVSFCYYYSVTEQSF